MSQSAQEIESGLAQAIKAFGPEKVCKWFPKNYQSTLYRARRRDITGRQSTQEETFNQIGYQPFSWQQGFHAKAREADNPDGPQWIGLGGSRGPGKTYAVLAQAGGDDALSYPGLQILYLRKTERALKVTFTQKLNEVLPPDRVGYEYSAHNGLMTYRNGSMAHILHFQSESDISLHQGQQWDVIVIEEASTLSESKLSFIRTSLRTTKRGWRPRIYLTWNWGGPGHGLLRRLFFDKRYMERERASDYAFFPSTVDDNPLIQEIDPDYVRGLDALTGWMYRSFRLGDPNCLGGTYFTNWNPERNVIPSREIPAHWKMFGSMDYGYGHLNDIQFHAINDQGNIETFRELTHHRCEVPVVCEDLFSFPETYRAQYVVAGLDIFDQSKTQGGPTIEQQYLAEAKKYDADNFRFERANTARLAGWSQMMTRIGNDTRPPTWFIHDCCHRLIECIPSLVHDPRNPDDVLKVNCDSDTGEGGDDPGDNARYALQSVSLMPQPTGSFAFGGLGTKKFSFGSSAKTF